jgi:hypothetical protein
MNLHATGRVPSEWIIEEYVDDVLYVKVSACNNHVLNYLIGSAGAQDIWDCPFQWHGDKFVITRRELVN